LHGVLLRSQPQSAPCGSDLVMLSMLLVANLYTGHTRQLRGSDLSSIPLPPLRATLSISFVAVLVPTTASLIGRPWNRFMFLVSSITFIILRVPRYFSFLLS